MKLFRACIFYHGALLLMVTRIIAAKSMYLDDICGRINGQRIYLDYKETGTLVAKYENNIRNATGSSQRCTIEFVTCPACIIEIQFMFLNISRLCEKSTVFDTCGCDYVWIYEPTFEQTFGEQFCGRFIKNNASVLNYVSQTRKVAVTFLYSKNYRHAFSLEYTSQRNRIILTGSPRFGNINNASQVISSPFFPNFYPTDLSMEHVIKCKSVERCRISLVFTDFQVAGSSIIEFFDFNGLRMHVTTGSNFRPPVIVSSGPSLVIRFYANGASNLGFKAIYSFVLQDLSEAQFKPDTGCGGYVNNLGGGITMMNMLTEGSKLFDCLWLVRPPTTYLHMKTHLYVKIITFENFAGSTELTIHQGLTSNGPPVENIRLPLVRFYATTLKEHVVPISQGFYISLKGLFVPESRLAIVYAAFNYKDCFAGSDFLCHNLRCISILLNCDGFDHCGDNSDELVTSCSKGLIGLIFVMAVLLYRINLRTRHQRQIQNHMETIHAILEESVRDIEEEIIVPDDPPDYEAPPEYEDVIKENGDDTARVKLKRGNTIIYNRSNEKRCSRCNHQQIHIPKARRNYEENASSSVQEISHLTSTRIPDSPPPAYEHREIGNDFPIGGLDMEAADENAGPSSSEPSTGELTPGPSSCRPTNVDSLKRTLNKTLQKLNPKGVLKRARSFLDQREHGLVKYFSDSQLAYRFDVEDDSNHSANRRCALLNLGRSFSTDDISMFGQLW